MYGDQCNYFFVFVFSELDQNLSILTWMIFFISYIAIIQNDCNTIINLLTHSAMDTLDLILLTLRYTPLGLMGISLLLLIRIQLKEFRRS